MKDEDKVIKRLDYIQDKLTNIFKSFGLILLYLCWSLFFVLLLNLFKINITNFKDSDKLLLSLVSDVTFFILILFIYHEKLIKDFKEYFDNKFGDNFGESLKYWGTGFIIMIVSNLIISLITNGKLATNEEAVREMIKISPIIMAFEVSIYAPIVEELLFRDSIKKITNHKYIYPILSGLIFGFLHVITSIDSLVSLLYLIPYSALGIAFACLYRKTDNIFSSIIVHSIHNTYALLLLVRML